MRGQPDQGSVGVQEEVDWRAGGPGSWTWRCRTFCLDVATRRVCRSATDLPIKESLRTMRRVPLLQESHVAPHCWRLRKLMLGEDRCTMSR